MTLPEEIVNDRVLREKEWHNENFTIDERESVSKFYSINSKLNRFFDETVIFGSDSQKTVFLDYGCGHGVYLSEIAEKIKKGIGIDISDERIALAKQNAEKDNIKNIEFFVMDATKTTFENEKFDIIRGCSIIHHLDMKLSLNEVKRILKNYGKAVFVEPLDTNPFIKLYRKMTPKIRTSDEQPLRRKDIKTILSIFPNTEIYYFLFFALFAVPFRNTKLFAKLFSILSFMDSIVLHKRSPFRWFAWICVIVMKK